MTNFLITAALVIFGLVSSVCAQDKVTNFGGTWNLDVAKSKLGERNNIESQTLTVTQSDKDIKVETATKRLPPPNGSGGAPQGPPPSGGMPGGPGGPPPGGGRPGGGMGGGDMPTTYSLDGKTTKLEVQGPMGAMPVDLTAKFESAKLKLKRVSSMNGPMGSFVVSVIETWEISEDGKTLTIKRTQDSPRGITSTELVFSKKQ